MRTEMNEIITIDGKDYEVLTTWKTATHAQLVTGVKTFAQSPLGMLIDGVPYSMRQINDNNIQPLKLIERKPVEFVGEVVRISGGDTYVDAILITATVEPGMKFRCVKITEEA